MKRVFKFRVWDGKEFDFTPTIWNGMAWDGRMDCEVENAVISQFTGLKDCEGIEIYEGDIINEDGILKVVEYGIQEVDAFEGVGFNLWDFYGEYKDIGKAVRLQESIKIEGNIFQNPELLNIEDD